MKAFIFSVLSLGCFVVLAQSASYNDVCGPWDESNHCNASQGLICSNTRCRCSNGTLADQITYNLVWDYYNLVCAGDHLSACIGTRRNPMLQGMKSVPCLDRITDPLSCIQVPGMPLGIGTCQTVPVLNSHGVTCSQDEYCDAHKSLVCNNGTCQCAKERENTAPIYNLVWDNEQADCVASVGSSCVGTRLHPVPSGGKAIHCVLEAECQHVEGNTPSVGVCVSRLETPPTTVHPDSTSTTEDPSVTTDPNAAGSQKPFIQGLILAVIFTFITSRP